MARRSLKETQALVRRWGWGKLTVVDHHAGVDHEGDPVDITFFRTGWEDADLSDLTLPRRYINRSTLERVSFRNTDLNQSFMCWNDFIDCDFTDADLTCADMRASIFRNCRFVRCKLICADMRLSSFEGCIFTGADMTAARTWGDDDLAVSEKQLQSMDVCDDPGPEPKGG